MAKKLPPRKKKAKNRKYSYTVPAWACSASYSDAKEIKKKQKAEKDYLAGITKSIQKREKQLDTIISLLRKLNKKS